MKACLRILDGIQYTESSTTSAQIRILKGETWISLFVISLKSTNQRDEKDEKKIKPRIASFVLVNESDHERNSDSTNRNRFINLAMVKKQTESKTVAIYIIIKTPRKST